jgi:hypothetical protein
MIDEIPLNIRQEIEDRLAKIEAVEDVRFLWVVESGSRAWGFPSPDSDYDVRFVYIRRRDWYLQLVPGRDVIEQPIVDDIDLNGWDIRKTLGLLLKSNAVVSEWLLSPIRYRPDHPAATTFATLADGLFDPRGTAHHYANLGRHAAERWLDGHEGVRVKKYFYALRPALAIRALRRNPGRRPAMNLQELMVEAEVPAALAGVIDELVAVKRQTREQGLIDRIPELDALIRDELSRASEVPERLPTTAALEAANAFFLELVRE